MVFVFRLSIPKFFWILEWWFQFLMSCVSELTYQKCCWFRNTDVSLSLTYFYLRQMCQIQWFFPLRFAFSAVVGMICLMVSSCVIFQTWSSLLAVFIVTVVLCRWNNLLFPILLLACLISWSWNSLREIHLLRKDVFLQGPKLWEYESHCFTCICLCEEWNSA